MGSFPCMILPPWMGDGGFESYPMYSQQPLKDFKQWNDMICTHASSIDDESGSKAENVDGKTNYARKSGKS